MFRRCSRRLFGRPASTCVNLPLMFVVMAIQTQQFPVAAIARIVVVIMIAMVNSELTKVLVVEFSSASATNPWVKLQSLFPVTALALIHVAPGGRDNLIQATFTS
jgi:hypothetical protein